MSECSQILQIIAFVTKVDTLSMVVQRVTGLVLTLHSEIKTVSVLARGPEISETVQKHHLFRQNCQTKGMYFWIVGLSLSNHRTVSHTLSYQWIVGRTLYHCWRNTIRSLDKWEYTVQPQNNWTYTIQPSDGWTYTVLTLECWLNTLLPPGHLYKKITIHWIFVNTMSNHWTVGHSLSQQWSVGHSLYYPWTVGQLDEQCQPSNTWEIHCSTIRPLNKTYSGPLVLAH